MQLPRLTSKNVADVQQVKLARLRVLDPNEDGIQVVDAYVRPAAEPENHQAMESRLAAMGRE